MGGGLGLLIPGAWLVALTCSIIGPRRVDPDASSPVGRRKQAIAGIILGVVRLAPTRIWVATPLFNVRL